MYYKIIEKFGPQDGKKWQGYFKWRGLTQLTCFDSIDGILRPDLFNPESDEDWNNCVNSDHKLNLITNLFYAKKIASRFKNADLVGVEIELNEGYQPQPNLLGYDVLDGYSDVSLLTNWGIDEERIMFDSIMRNGLVADLEKALKIRNILREKFPEDSHAENCQVWAIYKVDNHTRSSEIK